MPERPRPDDDDLASELAVTDHLDGWRTTHRLVDRDLGWVAPTLSLLHEQLPAGTAHPIFVPLAAFGDRALIDRILHLTYLHRFEVRFPVQVDEPEPEDMVLDIHRRLRPRDKGFLGRCMTAPLVDGQPDQELRTMTVALAMQTVQRVGDRVAGPRFRLAPRSPLMQDLVVEMVTRCLPVPEHVRRRQRANARDGYFMTYEPRKSFEAYIDGCFWATELEAVLKKYGRARTAAGESREIVLTDVADLRATPEPNAVAQGRQAERIAALDVPPFVWRHLEHPADQRIRGCCTKADRWMAAMRRSLGEAG